MDRSTFETSRPGFYAGGDLITGPSNTSNAMSGGKQAARKIDERLMGEERWDQLFSRMDYSHQAPAEPSLSHRRKAQALPAADRVHSQQEVITSLSPQEA